MADTLTSKIAPGANLRGANLKDADLCGADLKGADLSGADLSGADLSGAGLIGANLSGADLTGADLTCAHLLDAELIEATLARAKVGGADLRGADLVGANLKGADLRDADLSGADLTGADLTGAKQRGLELRGATLLGCQGLADEDTRNPHGKKMNALSKRLFEATPKMTPEQKQGAAFIKEAMIGAGQVVVWPFLPSAFGWAVARLQCTRMGLGKGEGADMGSAFGVLLGSDPSAVAIEAALGFLPERRGETFFLTTEYGRVAWQPGVGLWYEDDHAGAPLGRTSLLREWLKRSERECTLDELVEEQGDESLRHLARAMALRLWIERWALARFPALAHDGDMARFDQDDLGFGHEVLALMAADANRYQKRHKLSFVRDSTEEEEELADKIVYSHPFTEMAHALALRGSRPSQAARNFDRGRPSSGPPLWAWLLREHARTGMVPPPAEAVRQGIVGREGARGHYNRWLKRGLLAQPYKGSWLLTCGPARYREGF